MQYHGDFRPQGMHASNLPKLQRTRQIIPAKAWLHAKIGKYVQISECKKLMTQTHLVHTAHVVAKQTPPKYKTIKKT